MQIKFVEIENILSIGHLRLEFGNSGLTLLDGWNHDDDSANGAGKTAIPNAISYGLYNKIPRKISVSEILRRGTKKGYVHVGVQVGNSLLEIKRSRPKNIEYFIDGSKVDITQEEFENKLGMSYAQFLVCMYAAQTEGSRFISLNDTDKKDFILKLMDLDKFLMKKKDIDSKVKQLNLDKIEIEKVITGCESKKSVYSNELVDTATIKQEIETLSSSALEDEYRKSSEVPKPDYSKFESVRSKIATKLAELDEIDSELVINRRLYSQLGKEIADLESYDFSDTIECPSCNEQFISSSAGSIKIDELRDRHNAKIERKREKVADVIRAINDAGNTRNKREEIQELNTKLNIKIRQEEEAYHSAVNRIADLKSKIAIQQNTITSLKEKLEKQEGYRSKIAEIDLILDKANKKLAKINTDINLAATLSTILSPTGAPAYIVDTIVDIFNEKVSDYVAMIWPNATYRLQSFKENKSGDIKAKFSDKLVISGRDVSIGSLSGGEFRCLSLSVDFAIISVVESVFGFNVSPIFLDEPFEGLDSSNRERVVDLLEKISVDKQIWIIDHASEAKSMFTNTVKIEKKNGVSSII